MEIKISLKGINITRGQVKFDGVEISSQLTEGEVLQSNECCLELLRLPLVQKLLNPEDSENDLYRRQLDTMKRNMEILEKRIDALSKNNL